MNRFCRLLRNIFCCRCCRKSKDLEIDDVNTRLLPKNEKTKYIIEKDELYFFGAVPESLRADYFDLTKRKVKVLKIVCGNNHGLILLNNNDVAGFGSNEQGQLGIPLKSDVSNNYYQNLAFNQIKIPAIKESFEFIDIAAGENYSLLLIKVKDKSILFWVGITQESKYRDDIENVQTIHLVDLDYERVKISGIRAFGPRCLFWTTDNEIYVGGIDFNQLPLKKFKKHGTYTNTIKDIQLGLGHALLLNTDGELLAWGDNTYGELGIEKGLFLEHPTKVTFFSQRINKITTGARHSLVIDEFNKVFSFGDNSEGQCTSGGTRIVNPTPIHFESKDMIIDIFSGYSHCVLLTGIIKLNLANGEAYSWGDSMSGKLGYVDGVLAVRNPKAINILKGKYISIISLGDQMTVVATTSSPSVKPSIDVKIQ